MDQQNDIPLKEFIEKYIRIKMPDDTIKPMVLRDTDMVAIEFLEKCRKQGKHGVVMRPRRRAWWI